VVTAASPKELSQFRWIKTVLGNLKTSLSGTLHNVELRKYARRYLSGYLFRFHQHFLRAAMTARIANVACEGHAQRQLGNEASCESCRYKSRQFKILIDEIGVEHLTRPPRLQNRRP
jgi:hypothetical protein